MFAKIAVFFVALVTIVNAAPIITTMNPGVEPVVSLDTDPDVGVGVLGRALVGGDHANAHVTLPRLEGGGIDLSSSFGTVSTVPSSGYNSQAQGGGHDAFDSGFMQESVQRRRSPDMNRPIGARDTVINNQILSQLQDFVNNLANLLRASGNSSAADTFLSEANNLISEAQNGTLNT